MTTSMENQASSWRRALPPGKKYHVFFSCSSLDIHWVRNAVGTLEKDHGLVCCFYDRDSTPGTTLSKFAHDSIRLAYKTVVVMTGEAFQSGFVLHEIQMAMNQGFSENRNCVVPILLEDCGVPSYLSVLNYIDARDTKKRDIWWPMLLWELETHLTPKEFHVSLQRRVLPPGKKYHVFFNYSSSDIQWVKQTVEILEKDHGFICCEYDRDNTPGTSLLMFAEDSSRYAYKTVVVMSREAFQSSWFLHEIQIAIHQGFSENRNCVVPVLLEDCEVPVYAKVLDYVDARDAKRSDIWWPKLLMQLETEGKVFVSDKKEQPVTIETPTWIEQQTQMMDQVEQASDMIVSKEFQVPLQRQVLPPGKKYHVFFNYCSSDIHWVKETVETLEKAHGFICCEFDRDYTLERTLLSFAEDRIKNAYKTVVVMSREAFQSGFVLLEIQMAIVQGFSENRNCVVPVLLEDCDLPGFLSILDYVDARDTKRRDIWWPKLLVQLETPVSGSVIPMEILRMDQRSIQLYKEALQDGKEKVYNIRVMVVGQFGVGKTTLIKRLLGQQVDITSRESTEGIDVYKHCCKVVLETAEWIVQLEDSDQLSRLQRLVKLLTGQPERPKVSNKQDEQIEVLYKREISTEDLAAPVHHSASDDIQTSSMSGTYQNVDIKSKQIEKPSLGKADQKQEKSKGDATMEFLQLVNENAEKLKKSMVEFAALSIWDFAGQYIFYTTHQTFLTCRAIYLLVTDLSKQVTDLVKDDDCFIDAGGVRLCQVQDLVEIWFNSIHCCASSPTNGTLVTSPVTGSTVTPHAGGTTLTAPEASTTETSPAFGIPVTPPVILVGTHVDKIKKDKRQEVKSGYFQQICHILKDKPTSLHLMDFVAIDNTHVDPELKTLKDRIFELAKEQPYWGEEVPTNWLPLEEALMKLKAAGEKVIPLSLVEELNRGASVPIKTARQLDLFLRFQYEIGTILYFNVEGLREKIVLDPQWLIDALKSLITAEMFIFKKYPRIRDRWFEFRDKGKLTPELIDAIWSNKPEFHDNKQHILLLMEKLGVIAKPMSYTGELKEESYLAPCMLRDAAPKDVICPEENPQMEKTSLLCFEFTGKFLPPPVFHRLLAACVSHWQIATQNDKAQIFCGCCIFDLDLDRKHRISLYFRNYIIFVRVTRMGIRDMYKSSKICTEARTFISETLTRIIGNLGQSLKFELHIKCPDSDAESPKGLIAVSLLKKEENAVCHSHDKSHTLASQELLQFWFQEEETSPEINLSSPSPMPSPPISDTDRFMCIAYLLVDVGAQVLRRLFHHVVTSTCTVDQYLNNNKKAIENLKRIFNPSQMAILFPSGGNTCLDAYDITLLSALFQNIVPTIGTQEMNMIKSLRDDRNNIFGHASSCRISTSDYQMYWNSISSKLMALSKQCGDPAFETQISSDIQRIYGSAIPAGSYLDVLKAWFYRIETVEDELQDVKSRLQALESKEASSKSET